MKKINNYIALVRLNKPVAILLVYLPCLWGLAIASVNNNIAFIIIACYGLILAFGGLFARSFGCIVNDIVDRKIDAKIHRTKNRPVASGVISVKNAIIFAIICGLCCLFLLLLLPLKSAIVCVMSVPLICIYPLCKRFFNHPQLVLGIVFNLGIFVAYFCLANNINLSVVLLYFVAILWTITYDTIYAMQDIHDDIKHSVKSSAVAFGYKDGILQISKIKNTLLLFAFIIFILLNFVKMSSIAIICFYAASIVNVFIVIASFNDKINYRTAFSLSNIFGILVFIGLIL